MHLQTPKKSEKLVQGAISRAPRRERPTTFAGPGPQGGAFSRVVSFKF